MITDMLNSIDLSAMCLTLFISYRMNNILFYFWFQWAFIEKPFVYAAKSVNYHTFYDLDLNSASLFIIEFSFVTSICFSVWFCFVDDFSFHSEIDEFFFLFRTIDQFSQIKTWTELMQTLNIPCSLHMSVRHNEIRMLCLRRLGTERWFHQILINTSKSIKLHLYL